MSCNCKHEHEEEVQTPPSAQDIREYSKECKINEIYQAIYDLASQQETSVTLSEQPDYVIKFFTENGFTVTQEYGIGCIISWRE